MTLATADLDAAAWAARRLADVRDSPEGRLALLAETYRGTGRRAGRRLPYRRAARSFMAWEERRGLLNGPATDAPGSAWWRAVNARLLLDACEAVGRIDGRGGGEPSPSVRRWVAFASAPSAAGWWQAHNSSVVGAYADHQALAAEESGPERFFMNVVLLRVLYAHALIGNPRFALGHWAPLGRLLGDPRLGMTGIFLSLRRVLPQRYPLADTDVEPLLADENRAGRMLDYAVIAPRLQGLYEWSAQALEEPRLLGFIDAGRPTYAWPAEQGHVFAPPVLAWPVRALARTLHPR